MQIIVLKESFADEIRVALVPESVKKLVVAGNKVLVETGAGESAGATDTDYEQAGAEISSAQEELLQKADVLLAINRPADASLSKLKKGTIVVALLRPLDEPEKLQAFIENDLTAISLEMIPRTTRAQAMDVLSSMATIAGYKAVLLGCEKLPRMLPMMTTAAGTIPPAKVLIVGAGVAGLQAIATARRLGAVVEGFDIRAAAGEAVRSLGAKFLELENVNAEGEGGYAKEVGEDVMESARNLLTKAAANADCIITTAQIPGRRAPVLITQEAVEGMKSGSVIVDLAGANGGNCELSTPNEIVNHNGVFIYAPTNLAATIPVHASQLFSRNVTAFCNLLAKDGVLNLNFSDDILNGSCVVHQGEIHNERIREILAVS
jgi:NAD(P) transhydrogenase subunit alpha